MTVPAALHGFVVLAKSATGAACADLIKQATSANGVYTFTPLLQAENVQRLAGTEYEKSLNLLKLFSWGTYQDYKNNESSLPPLNAAQLDKLRRLTLVTLASESHDLPYATLMSSLDITTTRDLEDLCINTIYASLLTGKLSPHTQTFQITSCTSRDLSTTHTDYPGMISTLTQWSSQCDLVLAEIAGRIRDVRNSAASRKHAEDEFEKDLEAAKKAAQQGGGGGGGKKGKSSKSTLSGGATAAGIMSQQTLDDVNAELMQDVEEQHELMSPGRAAGHAGAGGESPSGRKRKGRVERIET